MLKKVLLYVEVDEDVLKEQNGADDLTEALNIELGWISQSGITLIGSKEVCQDNQKEVK